MLDGIRVSVDRDGAGPDFLRADARVIDRGLPIHARGLRRVRVELRALDHADALGAPIGLTVHARQRSLPFDALAGAA